MSECGINWEPTGEDIVATLRYVPHARIRDYARAGWTNLGLSPGHHGAYSCLMEWRGEGEPAQPDGDRPAGRQPRAEGKTA
jgi:hypothetical protein